MSQLQVGGRGSANFGTVSRGLLFFYFEGVPKDQSLRADYEKRYEALITVHKQSIVSHLARLNDIQRGLLRAVRKIKVKLD